MTINTSEVTKLIIDSQRLQKIKQQMGSVRYSMDSKPVLRLPKASPTYEKIGESIGMPGRELEYLMSAILEDPDEREIAAIKQLAFLGKLKHTEPTLKYANDVHRSQETYDREIMVVENAKIKYAALQEELDGILAEAEFVDMMAAWGSLIDELRACVEAHDNKVDDISGLDKAFWELIKMNSKHVRAEPDLEGTMRAVVVWDKVRDGLNAEHIVTILRKWTKVLENTNA